MRKAVIGLASLLMTCLSTFAQDITVKFNNTSYSSGDTLDFGDNNIGSSLGQEVYIINDAGTLNLTNTPFSASGDFTVSSQPASSSIVGLDSVSFEVTFTPTCDHGKKIGSLTIESNDVDEGTFVLNFKGNSVDTEAPIARCFGSDTLYLDAFGVASLAVNNVDSSSTDNCNIANRTLDLNAFSCVSVGTFPVTLTVEDDNNNTNTCFINITVLDTISPVITCPSNQTLDDDNINCSNIANGIILPGASDACNVVDTSYALTGATTASGSYDASGSTFNLGVTTVTYTIEDASSNTSSCSFTVTVSDTTSPAISCPGDQIIQDDNVSCDNILNGIGLTSATDNCSNTDTSYTLTGVTTGSGDLDASGTTFNLGTTTVTYTVQDAASNSTSCSFTVTVQDTTTPTLTCPSDQIIQDNNVSCDNTLNGIALVASNDNCSINSTAYAFTGATNGSGSNDASGSSFNVGVTTVTYTVQDAATNAASCNFTVTVNDTTTPVVICPSNQNIQDDNTNCSNTLSGIAVTSATDNCSVIDTSYVMTGATAKTGSYDASGSTFNVGVTTVTYTIEDASSNSTTCSFTVTVSDTTSPAISCPGDRIIQDDNVSCDNILNGIGLTSATDNCSTADTSYTLTGVTTGSGDLDASGTTFNLGTTTVTYTVQDAASNSSSCSFTVTVQDTTTPTLTCPGDQIIQDNNVSCDNTLNGIALVASNDNCSINSTAYAFTGATTGSGSNDASGSSFNVGVTNVTYTVQDAATNAASCSFTVTVNDTTTPVVICPSNQNIQDDNTNCSNSLSGIAVTSATDNCSVIDTSYVMTGATAKTGSYDASGSTFNVGVTTVTYTIEDASSNSTTCSFTVTVSDTTSPAISCPGDRIIQDDNVSCGNTLSGIGLTSSMDNCSVANTTYNLTGATTGSGPSDASGSTFNVGVTTVTYTVEDASSNATQCSFTVTVSDTTTPTISCPSDIEVCEPQIINYSVPVGVDVCGPSTNRLTGLGSGSTFPIGVTTETYEVQDPSGNSASCSFTVTVYETPTTAIAGEDEQICDSTYVLDGNTSSVGTAYWIVETGSGILIDSSVSTTIIEEVPYGNSKYIWRISNGVCPTSYDTVTISRDVEPTIADAGPSFEFCNEINRTLFGNSPSVGTGQWTIIEGSANILSPTTGISAVEILSSDTNTFVWTISNGVCVPERDTTVFINYQVPTNADAGTNNTLCTSFDTLDANTAFIGNGEWEIAFGFGLISDYNDPNALVTSLAQTSNEFVWVISNGVCPESRDTITITRLVEETVVEAGVNQTVCADSTILIASTPLVGIGQWIATGSAIVDDPNNTTTKVTNLDDGNNTFLWLVTNGTCPVKSDFVTIEKKDELPTPDAGIDQQVCADTTTFMTAVIPTEGTGTWSTLNGGGLVDNVTFAETFVRNLTTGENEFLWTLSSTGCEDKTDTVIIMRDGIAPEIICPTDTLISSDSAQCDAIYTFTEPIGTDNCLGARTAQIFGLPSGSAYPAGINTLTFEVTDTLGLTASCSFTVTVQDIELPTITCIDTILRTNDIGDCGKVVTYTLPSTSDNCSILSLTQTDATGLTSGDQFPIGFTTLTYTVSDTALNEASCNMVINVIDNEAPTIDCPNDTVYDIVNGTCEAIINYNDPVYTDNCTGVSLLLSEGQLSGSNFSPGTTTVTFIAQDQANLVSSCSFNITINDNEDPEITCPASITVQNDSAECGAIVTYSSPTDFDLCNNSNVSQIAGLSSGSLFPVGTTINTFVTIDQSGNSDTCSFEVTVEDTTLPEITCPTNVIAPVDSGRCDAIVNYIAPVGTDNCSGVFTTQTDLSGLSSGDTFSLGTTTLTYTSEDGAGNQTTCSFDVTLIDNEQPEITCPNDINAIATASNCGTQVAYSSPIGLDNCGVLNILQTDTTGFSSSDTFYVGTTVQTYTITDNSGNQASCSFNVTVSDGIDPIISCPSDTIISASTGNCGVTFTYSNPTFSDLCTTPTLTRTGGLSSGSFFDIGTTSISFEVEDEGGNTASCSFNISVEDNESPIFSNYTTIVVSTDTGECSAQVSYPTPSASDNCDTSITISRVTGPASGSIFNIDTTMIGYIATDSAGNTSDTLFFNIVVQDQELPIITCDDTLRAPVLGDICGAPVTINAPVGTDNCGVLSLLQTDGSGLSSGDTFSLGTTILTYTAEDVNGNSSTCNTTIIVSDDTDPIISCPNDTMISASLNNCGRSVTYNSPTASDVCSNVSVTRTAGLANGAFFPIGSTTVSFEAEDNAGNTAVCSFDIEITDDQNPEFNTISDVIVSTDPAQCDAIVTYTAPEAFDNCDTNVTVVHVFGSATGSSFNLGIDSVGFIAIDSSGNISDTVYMHITVEDNELPTITCPNTDTLCAEQPYIYTEPDFADNCSGLSFIQSTGLNTGDSAFVGTTTQTFTITDTAGNTASCSFSIVVIDTTGIPNIGADTSICGDVYMLSVNNNVSNTGFWDVTGNASIVDSLESNAELSISDNGTIELTWTSTYNGCTTKSDDKTIDAFLEPTTVSLGADTILCAQNSYLLSAGFIENGTGAWNIISGNGQLSNETDSTADLTFISDDSVRVQLTVSNGVCPDHITEQLVTSTAYPVISLLDDSTIFYNEIAQVQAYVTSVFDVDYLWSPDIDLSNPIDSIVDLSPLEDRLYYVKVTNAAGCSTTDSIQILVSEEIKVYTGLTPNGDGKNDTWVIRGIDQYPNAIIRVFNQWGTMIYESTGYEEPWDGTHNGNPVPFGSYHYTIDLKADGNTQHGTVTVIK